MAAGTVRYATNGDAQIAYRISDGGGPVLVALVGTVSGLVTRDHPITAEIYERVEQFCRLLVIDPRGTGRSDPVPAAGLTTETAVGDVLAVLDDAGLSTVTPWGFHAGGTVAVALTVAHPDRVDRLLLTNTWATTIRSDDTPWGLSPELSSWIVDQHRRRFGEGVMFADAFVPSRRGDPSIRQWFVDMEASASRHQAVQLTTWVQSADVSADLARVHVPTLVVHSARSAIPVENAHHLADHIDDARLVVIPSVDHAFMLSEVAHAFIDEVEAFVTGVRPPPRADRVFASVLFTDIVESTQRVETMGDGSWKLALADHDRITRETIERFGGAVVKSMGDGVLALFDTPSRAVRAASELVRRFEATPTPVRAGLHAGEVERHGDDVAGIAVHLAQRVCSEAVGGEVLVSRGLPDLVLGSGLTFTERGEHTLKGLDDPMQLWSVS